MLGTLMMITKFWNYNDYIKNCYQSKTEIHSIIMFKWEISQNKGIKKDIIINKLVTGTLCVKKGLKYLFLFRKTKFITRVSNQVSFGNGTSLSNTFKQHFLPLWAFQNVFKTNLSW